MKQKRFKKVVEWKYLLFTIGLISTLITFSISYYMINNWINFCDTLVRCAFPVFSSSFCLIFFVITIISYPIKRKTHYEEIK